MADYTFGVTKVNGEVFGNESLTYSMDFWSVVTSINILTQNDASGNGTAASQAALNKLVEIISENGQPVLLNAPTVTTGTPNTYTLKFAIEHMGSWGVDGTVLLAAIKAAGINYGFNGDTSLAVTLVNSL